MAEQDRRESRLESEYYAHMGFDADHKRDVLRFYVPMFEGPGDGAEELEGGKHEEGPGDAEELEGGKHGPVLEVGCGRGEFLGLLRDAGIAGRGVDLDAGMVEIARVDGFDVVHADAVEYLHADPAPGPFQGVFCAHFIEHLEPEQVARLLQGVRRVLAPGGRFVAVTPNPACYAVLTHDFWWDPTHVRFYDRPLVEFFCRQAGLEVESSGTNPANHPGPPPEYLAREPVVHPGVSDLVAAAMSKLEGAGPPRAEEEGDAAEPAPGEREEAVPGYPDHTWAFELAHVVNVLGDRLQEATQSLWELRTAHENLVWGLYQGNETFVVARR